MTSNQKLLERLTREEKLKYAASLRKVAREFIALAETFESDRCMPDGRPAIVYDPHEPAKGAASLVYEWLREQERHEKRTMSGACIAPARSE